MNGVPNSYAVQLTQTAKGVFYVERITVESATEKEMLEKLDYIVGEVKQRLDKLNSDVFKG